MPDPAKLGMIAGIAAFVLCLAGGLWLLTFEGAWDRQDPFGAGLGLYFVGKAFFVGPMLYLTGRMAARER